jgi:hypothetical protein
VIRGPRTPFKIRDLPRGRPFQTVRTRV